MSMVRYFYFLDNWAQTVKLLSLGNFISVFQNDSTIRGRWTSENRKTDQRRPVSSVVCYFDELFLERLQHTLRTLSCFSESTGRPASEPSHLAATESTAEPIPRFCTLSVQMDSSLMAHQIAGFTLQTWEAMKWRHAGLDLFFLFLSCCRSCYLFFFFTLHISVSLSLLQHNLRCLSAHFWHEVLDKFAFGNVFLKRVEHLKQKLIYQNFRTFGLPHTAKCYCIDSIYLRALVFLNKSH